MNNTFSNTYIILVDEMKMVIMLEKVTYFIPCLEISFPFFSKRDSKVTI